MSFSLPVSSAGDLSNPIVSTPQLKFLAASPPDSYEVVGRGEPAGKMNCVGFNIAMSET